MHGYRVSLRLTHPVEPFTIVLAPLLFGARLSCYDQQSECPNPLKRGPNPLTLPQYENLNNNLSMTGGDASAPLSAAFARATGAYTAPYSAWPLATAWPLLPGRPLPQGVVAVALALPATQHK